MVTEVFPYICKLRLNDDQSTVLNVKQRVESTNTELLKFRLIDGGATLSERPYHFFSVGDLTIVISKTLQL